MRARVKPRSWGNEGAALQAMQRVPGPAKPCHKQFHALIASIIHVHCEEVSFTSVHPRCHSMDTCMGPTCLFSCRCTRWRTRISGLTRTAHPHNNGRSTRYPCNAGCAALSLSTEDSKPHLLSASSCVGGARPNHGTFLPS